MGYLEENGIFTSLSEDIIAGAKDFSCGHPDLDDFFHNDCIAYFKTLFGKSYCFCSEDQEKVYRNIQDDEPLKTRLMFFDLIRIIE